MRGRFLGGSPRPAEELKVDYGILKPCVRSGGMTVTRFGSWGAIAGRGEERRIPAVWRSLQALDRAETNEIGLRRTAGNTDLSQRRPGFRLRS
jgi:hypothetical protein